jgi:probable F420-dependent oxidoreductase
VDIGVQIRNSGILASEPGVLRLACEAEAAGADSVWVGDHVCLVEGDSSRYPYATDGIPSFSNDTDWFEALIVLAAMSSVTSTVRLGIAALVLPQRHPIELAKQAATLDRLSGGRLDLGVGAGWNAGEMEALGWSFDTRGPRMDEMIEVLRRAWTGTPGPWSGEHVQVSAGVRTFPTPRAPIPLLVAGVNPTAIRRAARIGDGWLGITFAGQYSRQEIESQLALLDPLVGERAFRRIVKLHGSPHESETFPQIVAELADLGIDEAIVEVPWSVGIPEALKCLEACKLAAD